MEEFVERYDKVAGEWNDEAGTKVYALEIILATLQKAGKAAIDDVEVFKAAIPDFSVKNPFLKEDSQLELRRRASTSARQRQIGVPMVVNEFQDGEFKTLFVGSVEYREAEPRRGLEPARPAGVQAPRAGRVGARGREEAAVEQISINGVVLVGELRADRARPHADLRASWAS